MRHLFAGTPLDAEHGLAVLTPAGWIDWVAACSDEVSLWDDEDVLRHCAQAMPGATTPTTDRSM